MTKNKSNGSKFSTLEIHLAAYLEYRGMPADLENVSGRVIFTFPQSDTLLRLTNAYNSNDPVPVADYVGSLRSLRARMFASRADGRGVK